MSKQLRAQRACNDALTPLLEAAGFAGPFPYFHRLGARCLECVYVEVYVRGGVRLHVGSGPLPRGAVTRAQVQRAFEYGNPATRSDLLPGFIGIDTPKQLKAVPAKVVAQLELALRTGRTFWRNHVRDLEHRTGANQLISALEAGDAAGIKRVLSTRTGVQAQRLVAAADPRRWNDRQVITNVSKVAPLFRDFRPSYLLAATAAAGAAVRLAATTGSRAERTSAQATLDWVRPMVPRLENLGAQLAIIADSFLQQKPKSVRAALTLYDLALAATDLNPVALANALYAAMADNNHLPLDAGRHRRFARVAVKRAPDDAAVHFNAACLAMELGDAAAARRYAKRALELGAPLERVTREPLLRTLVASLEAPRRLPARTRPPQFITHRSPW